MRRHETSVSVIVAAANAKPTVGRAVRSALAQDHVEDVVVVDDASTDETAAAARSADDGSGRLEVIVLPKNMGPSAARNVALERSSSAFVCVLDADDYFLPGRIARLVGESEAWDLLADDILIVPENLDDGSLPASADRAAGGGGVLSLETFVLNNISVPGRPRGELGFLKPLIRRDFLRRHGLRYDEALRLGEDYALYVRALSQGARFRLIGQAGYVAVERKSSLSGFHSAGDLRRLADFDQDVLGTVSGLTAGERVALQAHHRATRKKQHHRSALDLKREQGLLPALMALARVPSVVPYVLSETMRAKLRSLAPVVPQEQRARFLIGDRLTGLLAPTLP